MKLTCRVYRKLRLICGNIARTLNPAQFRRSVSGLVERLVIAKPFDPEAHPNFNSKVAYIELREVWDDDIVQKALLYASKNPKAVYGKATIEYDRVKRGYFDLYFSISRSTSSSDRR